MRGRSFENRLKNSDLFGILCAIWSSLSITSLVFSPETKLLLLPGTIGKAPATMLNLLRDGQPKQNKSRDLLKSLIFFKLEEMSKCPIEGSDLVS